MGERRCALEGLALVTIDSDFWKGRRVFLTGHTGFKGGWLSLWLARMRAEVYGFALEPPTSPNLFDVARVGDAVHSTIGDVRDLAALRAAVEAAQPEVIFHMAAQPLVRHSYAAPVETFATNVMGTVHLLEAARLTAGVRAVVNVTTDKCYENREWVWGYREDEPMGGYDPYSSSKGCSELATSAYRRSYPNAAPIASARAGNVIGGGDWAEDRLVPDILRAFERREPVVIRNPISIRPWQHVLEPLSGYLLLAQRLATQGAGWAEAWNFGPADADARPVRWIVERLIECWGDGASWRQDGEPQPHEAHHLKLDISKAASKLGWRPRWSLQTALDHIIDWHQAWLRGADMQALCLDQIASYLTAVHGNPE